MSNYPYTLVEFKDSPEAAGHPLHKAGHIYINGQEVLVEKGSVLLDFGDDCMTTVTLTLQPNEIRFNK